jgi:hypothetical protein
MDEVFGIAEDEFQIPLTIPDEASVYRQVHYNELDKDNRRYPKASHFKLKEGEADLSVNWDQWICSDEVYHIIGLSHNARSEFKDIRKFKIFKISVDYLRKLSGIEKVSHSPKYNGNPAPIGKPNNYSHSSVFYPDDEEIRKKLSNYCNDNDPGLASSVNYSVLEKIIDQLKERLNETKYHRCLKTK